MKKKTETIKPEDAVKKLRDIFIELGEKQLELAKIARWVEDVQLVEKPSEKLLQEAEEKKQRIDQIVKEIAGLGSQVNEFQGIYDDLTAKFGLKKNDSIKYIK